MKKLIISCLLLNASISLAQDAQLTDHTWTLENVIINGQNNFPPSNEESLDLNLWFNYDTNINYLYLITNSSCNTLTAENVTIDGNQSNFNLNHGFITTLADCLIPENSTYEGLYFGTFYDDSGIPFLYNITSNGNNTQTLIITNPNGRQAVFGRSTLSTTQFDTKDVVSIYPNPVKDILTISANNNIKNVSVIDLQGRVLQNKILNNKTVVMDMSTRAKGIYFVKIKTDKGTNIKKIIKS